MRQLIECNVLSCIGFSKVGEHILKSAFIQNKVAAEKPHYSVIFLIAIYISDNICDFGQKL